MKSDNDEIALLCLAFAVVSGVACGETSAPADGSMSADTSTDVALDAAVDGGEVSTTTSFDLTFIDEVSEEPLQGVHVAFDTDVGRFEGSSDADGALTITIEHIGPTFDVLAAKEGYVIVGAVGASVSDIDDSMPFRVSPIVPSGEGWNYRVSVSGVPAGGQACASLFGPGWFMLCSDAGSDITGAVGAGQVPHDVATIFAIDESGVPVDFEEVALVAEGRNLSAAVTFDSTPDITPVTRSITLQVPEGPMRDSGVNPLPWMVAALDSESEAIRSYLSDIVPSSDGSELTMTYTAFPDPTRPMFHMMALFTLGQPAGSYVRSIRFFPGDLTSDTLGATFGPGIIDSGRELSGEFAWNAPRGDERSYTVLITGTSGNPIYRVLTWSETGFSLPSLPSAYDPDVSYPLPGWAGRMSVEALYSTEPADLRGERPEVEAEVTNGEWHPIVF